jgi:hypothetical protein
MEVREPKFHAHTAEIQHSEIKHQRGLPYSKAHTRLICFASHVQDCQHVLCLVSCLATSVSQVFRMRFVVLDPKSLVNTEAIRDYYSTRGMV